MEEFGIIKKLIPLTKICIEDAQYRIRVEQTISEAFVVSTGLKQRDSLSPILLNSVGQSESVNSAYKYLGLQMI